MHGQVSSFGLISANKKVANSLNASKKARISVSFLVRGKQLKEEYGIIIPYSSFSFWGREANHKVGGTPRKCASNSECDARAKRETQTRSGCSTPPIRGMRRMQV